MVSELEEVSSRPPLVVEYEHESERGQKGLYIVELKAIKNLTRVEWAQVVHYMRATRTPYGLLLNFGRPQFQYDTFDKGSLPKIFDDRGGLEETSSR